MPTEIPRGLRTVIYPAPDLARAKTFYSALFGTRPYFDEAFYVGFNVGGFELGLDPDLSSRGPGLAGGLAYWGVKSLDDALVHAADCGAVIHAQAKDVGGGIRVGAVKDPFGNVIGLIENPHFQFQE